MIGFIQGVVRGRVVLTASGVGYVVSTSDVLVEGSQVELHTSMVVRDDAVTLYGFQDPVDLDVFTFLLKAPGVGPQLAMVIIQSLGSPEVIRSLKEGDAAALAKSRGVGRKKADSMCLALKDVPENLLGVAQPSASPSDALLETLVGMGYDRSSAQEAVDAAKATGVPGRGSTPAGSAHGIASIVMTDAFANASQRAFLEALVVQELSHMGGSAEEVADYLEERDVSGLRYKPASCPVARWLDGMVKDAGGEVLGVDEREVSLKLGPSEIVINAPSGVAGFVKAFDSGDFPELDDEWEEDYEQEEEL